MATDTNVGTLIINKMTQAQYDALTEKDPTQVYVITDAPGGGGSGTDNNGLEGDYATTYGIDDETKSGLPYIKAVGSKVVVIPAPLELDVPGQPGLTTIASTIEYEVQSTDNPTLFYAQGEIIEATDVFFQVEEPENGTTGYAAWWNGTTWQFKSNDTGNVWRPANAARIAKCVFTGASLTRLCFTGCIVRNKQEYLSRNGGILSGSLVMGQDAKIVNAAGCPFLSISEQGHWVLSQPGYSIDVADLIPINNLLGLGSSSKRWAIVYTSSINNGATISVPNKAGTFALLEDFNQEITTTNKGATMADVAVAATSGTLVKSFWFGKTDASTEVPAPTLPGQNYYDFTTGQIYKSADGTTWTLDSTYTPPADIDVQIGISSKFWDIAEQENQHGGVAKWSHTNSDWSYYPDMYESKPAGGASLPLLAKLLSTANFNNISYLKADTFSWQEGSAYQAVYQHLVDDLSTAGAVQTVTIEGITVSYEVATDGHRICLPTQEDNISALYAKTGEADFYILDTENGRFKLPRTQKRKLIRAVKNADGSWYNLYSDGWVEQGGVSNGDITTIIQLPVAMTNGNYYVNAVCFYGTDSTGTATVGPIDVSNLTTTTIRLQRRLNGGGAQGAVRWEVKGYAADSVLANEPVQYEYYYVGNFTQTAIEQTAGINAEMFNQKVDVGHQVIEFQAPTADNNYTWYRKYADGWVEQGGFQVIDNNTNVTVNLPVTMANSYYTVTLGQYAATLDKFYTNQAGIIESTTTTVTLTNRRFSGTEIRNLRVYWMVCGMAA